MPSSTGRVTLTSRGQRESHGEQLECYQSTLLFWTKSDQGCTATLKVWSVTADRGHEGAEFTWYSDISRVCPISLFTDLPHECEGVSVSLCWLHCIQIPLMIQICDVWVYWRRRHTPTSVITLIYTRLTLIWDQNPIFLGISFSLKALKEILKTCAFLGSYT